jgi:hypothetical protein
MENVDVRRSLLRVSEKKSAGKEVLTSYSHRGFSPVTATANRIEEPFQRFSWAVRQPS